MKKIIREQFDRTIDLFLNFMDFVFDELHAYITGGLILIFLVSVAFVVYLSSQADVNIAQNCTTEFLNDLEVNTKSINCSDTRIELFNKLCHASTPENHIISIECNSIPEYDCDCRVKNEYKKEE